ncbi:hypothetical protein KSP40_PGU002937 [Platanthera guangdongensis]|uniref:Uncharacterized protein n=1 Tax=Platanthera guangdongensis TaxID=2320717 RepID=A0ABR2LP15_9ASPA
MAPRIVTLQNLKLLFELQKKVDELHEPNVGSVVSLANICTKPLIDDCSTLSVLQVYVQDLLFSQILLLMLQKNIYKLILDLKGCIGYCKC